MSETVFFSALRQAALASQQNEYAALESYEFLQTEIVLSEEEISKLAERILALPHELRDALFAHYYFGLNANETARLFNLNNPMGKLNYACRLLSLETKFNDDNLNAAVEIAVKHYTTIENRLHVIPKYSNRFRRTLRDIDAIQATRSMLNIIMHRVAVVLLVFAISFSTALVVDADFREDFFNWLIETFPVFSIFYKDENDGQYSHVFSTDRIEIAYIPIGFEFGRVHEGWSKIVYHYYSDNSDDFVITFSKSNPVYADTEKVTINEITLKGEQAYWWTRNSRTYLVWTQNNISCDLSGKLPLKEAIKIAKQIKIY